MCVFLLLFLLLGYSDYFGIEQNPFLPLPTLRQFQTTLFVFARLKETILEMIAGYKSPANSGHALKLTKVVAILLCKDIGPYRDHTEHLFVSWNINRKQTQFRMPPKIYSHHSFCVVFLVLFGIDFNK